MNILFVLTSHGERPDDRGTGMDLGDFASAYYLFRDAGYDIALASPAGGMPAFEGTANAWAGSADLRRLRGDRHARTELSDSIPLDGVYAADFDGVYYPGGSGALIDLSADRSSARLIESFTGLGRPTAFNGDALAALLPVRGADGAPLVRGRALSAPAVASTNPRSVELAYLLEALGARVEVGDGTGPLVVADGALLTGRDRQSARALASRLDQHLREKEPPSP